MQFAAFALAGSSAREDPEVIFRRIVEYAIEAEQLGYDAVWFAEHHFSNYGYIPNPLLMATRIAAETSKIRVGTAVLVLPFWDPLRVAEDIALTDQLTNGRLEVGVARGYQPFEFRRFGLTMDDARDQTDEALAIISKALSGETFEFNGKYHQIPETTLYPKPLQQPTPPIWLAATTQESFDIGRRYGLRSLTSQSGRPVSVLEQAWANFQNSRKKFPDSPAEFGVQGQVVVTPSEEESHCQMEHFLYQSRQATALRHGREHVRPLLGACLVEGGAVTVDGREAVHAAGDHRLGGDHGSSQFTIRWSVASDETPIRSTSSWMAKLTTAAISCQGPV